MMQKMMTPQQQKMLMVQKMMTPQQQEILMMQKMMTPEQQKMLMMQKMMSGKRPMLNTKKMGNMTHQKMGEGISDLKMKMMNQIPFISREMQNLNLQNNQILQNINRINPDYSIGMNQKLNNDQMRVIHNLPATDQQNHIADPFKDQNLNY